MTIGIFSPPTCSSTFLAVETAWFFVDKTRRLVNPGRMSMDFQEGRRFDGLWAMDRRNQRTGSFGKKENEPEGFQKKWLFQKIRGWKKKQIQLCFCHWWIFQANSGVCVCPGEFCLWVAKKTLQIQATGFLLLKFQTSKTDGSLWFNWWFGFLRSPHGRNFYLGVPLESQTTGPQTTNKPVVEHVNCLSTKQWNIQTEIVEKSGSIKGFSFIVQPVPGPHPNWFGAVQIHCPLCSMMIYDLAKTNVIFVQISQWNLA